MADILLSDTPTRDDEDADLELGRIIRGMVTAKFGAEVARKFCDAMIIPTRPGATERTTQDRVFGTMLARVDKMVEIAVPAVSA